MNSIYRRVGDSGARWLPALALAGLIAWFSHQPQWPDAAQGYPDWLLHGGAFGALAFCVLWGATRGFQGLRIPLKQCVAAVLVASLYGAIDELHQSFIPGRDAAVGDWVADSLGALTVVIVVAATFAGLRALWENRGL